MGRSAREKEEIREEDYAEELDDLTEIRNELLTAGLIVDVPFGPIHGETFHTRGGVVQLEEKYLLGLTSNPAPPPVYELEEYSINRNIFWGETREAVIQELSISAAENQ